MNDTQYLSKKFTFDNSYARLPERFYERLSPTKVPVPKLIKLNEELALELGLDPEVLNTPSGVEILSGNCIPDGAEPLAMMLQRSLQVGASEKISILKEKKIQLNKSDAEDFYKVHQTKPFYNDLCAYLSSGPIIVMVLQKNNAVIENRKLMGATDPKKSEEGTLRKKFGISIDKNSVHGSDSIENAKIEIGFFFKD